MRLFTPSTLCFGTLGVLAALGGLSGCMTEPAASGPFIGKSVDSIQFASQLLVYNGQLLVGNRSAVTPGTAVIDTSTGLISAYYGELLPPSSMAVTSDSEIVITETNYTQGAVSVLNLSTKELQKSVITFSSDNFVDTAGGRTYLFDHTTGAVTGFTGHEPNANIVFNAQTGGSGSDPYDIAVSGGLAFIPRYDQKSLLVLNPALLNGGTPDSIDLSSYVDTAKADSAFLPRMAWATAYNGFIFVALQRLNVDYAAQDTSLVVVINAATKQVTSVIPLHFKNPISAHVVGSSWYLTSVANYDQTGGVEKIDLSQLVTTSTALIAADTMKADLYDFVPTGSHSGFVAYSTDYGVMTQVKKVSF